MAIEKLMRSRHINSNKSHAVEKTSWLKVGEQRKKMHHQQQYKQQLISSGRKFVRSFLFQSAILVSKMGLKCISKIEDKIIDRQ